MSDEVKFIQSGTGTPVRTVRSMQARILTFGDFGVDINGGRDDHAAVLNCIAYARESKLLIKLPGGGYLRVFPTLESE